jgi:hypothetical protein
LDDLAISACRIRMVMLSHGCIGLMLFLIIRRRMRVPSGPMPMIAAHQGVDQGIKAAGCAWAGHALHARTDLHGEPHAWMYPRTRASSAYWFSVFDGLK